MVNQGLSLSFVFMNDSFEQLTVWRPRAKEVQNFVNKIRSNKLPDKTHPNFDFTNN